MEQAAPKSSKKIVISSKCIGCGACVAIAGDAFEFAPDGMHAMPKLLDSYEGKNVETAIASCPMSAISWQ